MQSESIYVDSLYDKEQYEWADAMGIGVENVEVIDTTGQLRIEIDKLVREINTKLLMQKLLNERDNYGNYDKIKFKVRR